MGQGVDRSSQVRFGLFRADLETGELWKAGNRLKLQSQPFKILKVLLEHPGEIVTRDALQSAVWGPNVVVDYEQSLGSAVKKIREAIQDSADNPTFIETVPRKGYRFIAPVTWTAPRASEPPPVVSTVQPAPHSVAVPRRNVGRPPLLALMCGVGIGLFAAATPIWYSRHQPITPRRISQITYEGRVYSQGLRSFETLPATVADGERLFTSSILDRQAVLSQVSVSTGEMQRLQLPSEVTEPEIEDLSPDSGKLLVLSQSAFNLESEHPLWIIPTGGGSAARVANVLAHAAVWMPDGQSILYARGDELSEVAPDSGVSRHVATVPGRAFWMRWSPDGSLLRFTILNIKTNQSSLWELAKDQKEAHQVLNGWNSSRNACCGVWTPDGRQYIFQATRSGHSDLWRLSGKAATDPSQVTNGPFEFQAPAAAREGDRIYFLGRSPHVDWREQEYDIRRKQLQPRQDFLATAGRVTFSRDHQWVAWTDVNGHLWRARVNGTEKLQLTPESVRVLYTNWAPDGKSLAIMAQRQNEAWAADGRSLAVMAQQQNDAWQIFRIPLDGGGLENLLQHDLRGAGNPTFSPDGQSLLFSGPPNAFAADPPQSLQVLDLKTRQVSVIPDSVGFHTPRWSPDGRYIAALDPDRTQLMMYDLGAKKWKVLVKAAVSDPVWVSDSKAIYVNKYESSNISIYRVSVPDGRVEQDLIPGCGAAANRCFLSGITPDDVPLVVVETTKADLYSIDLPSR